MRPGQAVELGAAELSGKPSRPQQLGAGLEEVSATPGEKHRHAEEQQERRRGPGAGVVVGGRYPAVREDGKKTASSLSVPEAATGGVPQPGNHGHLRLFGGGWGWPGGGVVAQVAAGVSVVGADREPALVGAGH